MFVCAVIVVPTAPEDRETADDLSPSGANGSALQSQEDGTPTSDPEAASRSSQTHKQKHSHGVVVTSSSLPAPQEPPDSNLCPGDDPGDGTSDRYDRTDMFFNVIEEQQNNDNSSSPCKTVETRDTTGYITCD